MRVQLTGRLGTVAPAQLAEATAELHSRRRASERPPNDEVLKPLKDAVRLAARARAGNEKKPRQKKPAVAPREKDPELPDEDQDVLQELAEWRKELERVRKEKRKEERSAEC